MSDGSAFDVVNPDGQFPVIFTCEHASCALPAEYQGLGISTEEICRHIGWDIGARAVVESLAQTLGAPAVCSGYSRLLIDCNRDLCDRDLIVPESDDIKIPYNQDLAPEERQKRITHFYQPYHEAIDQLIADKGRKKNLTLWSIHSFTPVLRKKERQFDIGILFNRYDDLAREVGRLLYREGYRVRYNEPYSGYDGLIFSAQNHGERHGLVYLELEINNSLIAEPTKAAQVGRSISRVFHELFAERRSEVSDDSESGV